MTKKSKSKKKPGKPRSSNSIDSPSTITAGAGGGVNGGDDGNDENDRPPAQYATPKTPTDALSRKRNNNNAFGKQSVNGANGANGANRASDASNGVHERNGNRSRLDSPASSALHEEEPQILKSQPQRKLGKFTWLRCQWWISVFVMCLIMLGVLLPLIFTAGATFICGSEHISGHIRNYNNNQLMGGGGSVVKTLAQEMNETDRIVPNFFQKSFHNMNKEIHRKKSQYSNDSNKGREEGHLKQAHAEMFEDGNGIIAAMCDVASFSIGRFILFVPYGSILLRYPAPKQRFLLKSPVVDDKNDKIGIFQRVLNHHKQKHASRVSSLGHGHLPTSPKSASPASEEIDRLHPLRHILEGASVFFHHVKENKEKRTQQNGRDEGSSAATNVAVETKEKKQIEQIKVDWSKWKYAMSDDFTLNSEQVDLIRELAKRVLALAERKQDIISHSQPNTPNTATLPNGDNNHNSFNARDAISFHQRVNEVPWGGLVSNDYAKWWPRKDGNNNYKSKSPSYLNEIDRLAEGGRLLAAYLKIMKWPKDLHSKFPFKLCTQGCSSETAILHTLEWREKYKPWCISPTSIQQNQLGFVYYRGHSRAGPEQRKQHNNPNQGHTMVWYRPGISPCTDPELYMRAIIHTLEHAVAKSLLRNQGTIGRFNFLLDCQGVTRKSLPSIASIKKGFTLLQDHFPDRLGVLLVANLSGLAQMLMKVLLPFVTEEVRAKIHVVPSGDEGRREMLNQFMDEDQIPDWLGGLDGYRFDANEYYYKGESGETKCVTSEKDVVEYLTTMPYHA